MSHKIFPHRQYNPFKCRFTAGLPEPPPPNPEEQRIMRELLAEQAQLALAKRAASLPPAPPKVEPIHVSVWAFEPDYVLAYDGEIPRRVRRTCPPVKRRALDEARKFLRRFRTGEKLACEVCEFDITASEPNGDKVPYGIFVAEQGGVIQASGLCRDCALSVGGVSKEGTTDDGRLVEVTVMEWMATVGLGPDR